MVYINYIINDYLAIYYNKRRNIIFNCNVTCFLYDKHYKLIHIFYFSNIYGVLINGKTLLYMFNYLVYIPSVMGGKINNISMSSKTFNIIPTTILLHNII